MTSEGRLGALGAQVEDSSMTRDVHDIDSRIRNLSVQTGEEFSTEFIRERTPGRKENTGQESSHKYDIQTIQDYPQKHHRVSRNLLLDTLEDCPLDDSQDHSTSLRSQADNHSVEEVKYAYSDNDRVDYNNNCVSGVLDGSFCWKMKFLCSFGGKILPRPSDGKLRYVGGETRIISITKNLNYQDFLKKTSSFCCQPHTIKYQLPDEDLHALISVSSDEDLQHMIEEYHELEKGSQRLRIFLISSNDPESPCSNDSRSNSSQQTDKSYEYVVAVNGMKDLCVRKNSSKYCCDCGGIYFESCHSESY